MIHDQKQRSLTHTHTHTPKKKEVTAKHTLGRIRHSKPLILNSKFGLSLE